MKPPKLSNTSVRKFNLAFSHAEVRFLSEDPPEYDLSDNADDPQRAARVWQIGKTLDFIHTVFFAAVAELMDGDLPSDEVRSEMKSFFGDLTEEVFLSKWPRLSSAIGVFAPCSDEEDYARYTALIRDSRGWRELQAWLLELAQMEVNPDSPNRCAEQRETVDRFLKTCTTVVPDRRINRTHIWKLAGHSGPRQFQHFQAGSDKATLSDHKNFKRILALHPSEFVAELKQKKILP